MFGILIVISILSGCTALGLLSDVAIVRGDLDVARIVVEQNPVGILDDPAQRGKVIEGAVRHGHLDIINLLEFITRYDEPCSHVPLRAVMGWKGTEYLLALPGDVSGAIVNRWHPVPLETELGLCLYMAAKSGDSDRAEILLRYGANVNAPNDHDKTPLFAAANRGDMKMVQFLLANGAHVNSDHPVLFYTSPLLAATERRDKAMVHLLRDHDPDIRRADVQDLLHTSVHTGVTEAIQRYIASEDHQVQKDAQRRIT